MVDRVSARVIGFSGWPVFLIAMALLFLLPAVEAKVLPVRTDQSVGDVSRGLISINGVIHGDALCWTWTSIKRRARVSDNLDAFLVSNGRRFVIAPYRESSGDPWNAGQAVPVDPTFRPQPQRYCADVPPSVRLVDPIRVEQLAFYPSLFPGLHVTLRLPDVIAAGALPL